MTSTNLVFDLGFHRGEDTDHYLAIGHRVVAVEANPSLAEDGRQRFAAEISSGQLQLIHAAVVGHKRRGQLGERQVEILFLMLPIF